MLREISDSDTRRAFDGARLIEKSAMPQVASAPRCRSQFRPQFRPPGRFGALSFVPRAIFDYGVEDILGGGRNSRAEPWNEL